MADWTTKLQELGQGHLVDAQTGAVPATIADQLGRVDANYPGGVAGYLANARRLLDASRRGVDSFAGYKPSVPQAVNIDLDALDKAAPELKELEKLAQPCLGKLGFVLVAGGLGERLGYPDIKIKLFTQVTQEMTYIEYYCRSILTLQQRAAPGTKLPFFIMTSGDTHDRTVEFLMSNKYFGLDESQVYIRQQEKVPALKDNEARIALSADGKSIETKPHGHGDVHLILYQSGLVEKWRKEHGTEYLFFFQDTNCLSFRALSLMLGVTIKHGLTMNSLAIPRLPGEAVGALCHLTHDDGSEVTLNVEYNQLDALLKSCGEADVPVPREQGGDGKTSKYPGNCNILMFNVKEYLAALETSKGLVPEFVNPKYADASKTAFLSPTRIECMMQEIPRTFSREQKHGCTVLNRWFAFSTVKNNHEVAQKRVTPECAFSAEEDLYYNTRRCLEIAQALAQGTTTVKPVVTYEAAEFPERSYLNVKYRTQPRIWLSPAAAVTLTQMGEIVAKLATPVTLRAEEALIIKDSTTSGRVVPLPLPVELTEAQMADPAFPANYKVRGYQPATKA